MSLRHTPPAVTPCPGVAVSSGGFVVRAAHPADAAELARLRYEFRTELDPPTESQATFVSRCTDWMARELEPGGVWHCWVAILGGTMVGTIWLQLIEKLPNPNGHLGLHGYISSVYVVPALRNGGIGSALMDACLVQCQAREVDAVFLWPSSRSRPLYQRHGFAVRDDLLERR